MKSSTTGRIVSILTGCGVFVLLILTVGLLEYALIGGVLGWLAVSLIYDKSKGIRP